MKKWIAGAVLAAGIVSVGGTAFAGEVGGSTNGKANGPKATVGAFTTGEHANSICAFSGLADGGEGEPSGPGNVQNWGHVDRSVNPSPGFACNGHRGFLAGGGGE
jgi:hypothetical protein